MHNFRYALRQLTRQPGFSIIIILMLSLGIGVTSAVFSVFHTILLQRLPVSAPEQLVNFRVPGPKWGSVSWSDAGGPDYVFNYPMFRDLESRQTVFSGIAAHVGFEANLNYEARTMSGQGVLVSGSYFHVLNLRPALGRLIGPQDEPGPGESAVVVLSYEYWQNKFGGDPDVLGRTMTVNGRALTVIGVTSAGFTGTTIGSRPQVFVPLTLRWLMNPTAQPNPGARWEYWVYLFARLRPGVTIDQASAEINVLYSSILNEIEAPLRAGMPANLLKQFLDRRIIVEPGSMGQSDVPDRAGLPLTLLLGIASLVLMIVCINIANLLLTRGVSRSGEMAIRASMGASRGRLASLLFMEGGVLAVLGGVLSLPVASITLGVINAMSPAQLSTGLAIKLDPIAVIFAVAVSLFSLLLFSLIPALQTTRTEPALVIKEIASRTAGSRRYARLFGMLSALQIVFSMVLLVLAGLFTQSLMNLTRVNLGMDVDSLLTFSVSPRLNGYSPDRIMNAYNSVEEKLSGQPGVISVASSVVPLLGEEPRNGPVFIDGFDSDPEADVTAWFNSVSPGYFHTLSVPLLKGRDFASTDIPGSTRVAIVNESFVSKFNLGNDVIGRHFATRGATDDNGIEIIGVVADAKYSDVKSDIPPQYYLPRKQDTNFSKLYFYVRGSAGADVLMRIIQRVVAEVDPNLPVNDLITMEEQVRSNIYFERLVAMLSGGFAVLATLLAAIGLYGVLAYNVAQRTREIGLRLALGATRKRLYALVFRQIGLIGLTGFPVGLAAALALGHIAEALLFGLSAYDPVVMLTAVLILTLVVFAAGYIPARRASRLDPMQALREE